MCTAETGVDIRVAASRVRRGRRMARRIARRPRRHDGGGGSSGGNDGGATNGGGNNPGGSPRGLSSEDSGSSDDEADTEEEEVGRPGIIYRMCWSIGKFWFTPILPPSPGTYVFDVEAGRRMYRPANTSALPIDILPLLAVIFTCQFCILMESSPVMSSHLAVALAYMVSGAYSLGIVQMLVGLNALRAGWGADKLPPGKKINMDPYQSCTHRT